MHVEIEIEAAQFPEKEYINGILVAVLSLAGTQTEPNTDSDMFLGRVSGVATM